MRAVVQRVSEASVTVEGRITGSIGTGLLVLLGVTKADTEKDATYLADKIVNLRVFPDARQMMNLSVAEQGGEVLVVSQFTLYGDCRKGRRPSYAQAAPSDLAARLYRDVIETIRATGLHVASGEFQAMMQVSLINDGPVTILLDSGKLF